ncbi:DUF3540 domain-containing protein [Rhizobium sp. SL86]|uniref:DUF3540 domain-containing protein n=1 Tax=Rhizobium sp. SL86 TaxID=2995148 RepID=UPI002273228B|nr:DUF3540 domain-containing protein [Rhizobium sp. SL86]MCY1669075.1 DUF3540 domain-containing protein [Rhizobium sp. SL86]
MLERSRPNHDDRPPQDLTAASRGQFDPAPAPIPLSRAVVKFLLTPSQFKLDLPNGDTVMARQAASCLLAPAIGDTVLVHIAADDSYILAVLERSAARTAELGVPDATDVTLSVAGRLNLSAQTVGLAAGAIEILSKTLLLAGESLTSRFRRMTETVSDKISSARSLTATFHNRTTLVKEVDMLEARMQVQTVETVSTHNSEIALITASRDIRLDGERVSVG